MLLARPFAAFAALALATTLTGCAIGAGSPASEPTVDASAQPIDPTSADAAPAAGPDALPHQYELPFTQVACTGTVTFGSSSDAWVNWPEGSDQYRLESPDDQPQWSATALAFGCLTREALLEHDPSATWSAEHLFGPAEEHCPVWEPIEVEGFSAAQLCLETPGGASSEGSFGSHLSLFSDEHYLVIAMSVSPDLRGTNGTRPGDVEQARPMLDLAEEALRHVRVEFD